MSVLVAPAPHAPLHPADTRPDGESLWAALAWPPAVLPSPDPPPASPSAGIDPAAPHELNHWHAHELALPPAEAGSDRRPVALHDIPQRIGLSDMDGLKYMAFGSLFIISVDSMLFPLDTIKTIIMAERSRHVHRQGLIKMVLRIAHHEGVARFWHGLAPSVIGSFPGQAMYYLAYESAQELSKAVFSDPAAPATTFAKGFLSGACAEFAGGLFYVPADIIAQRLQIQSTKGFVHNSSAYAPASAVQWGSYELFKGILFRGFTYLESSRRISDGSPIPFKENLVNSISGGLSATCAITANNPLEILRIRTQLLESRNKRDAEHIRGGYLRLAACILREEGWKAFYRGLRVRLIVTVPSAMVAMSGYEAVKAWSADGMFA
nr:Fe(2+) transporter [Polyrhizophydium stewartii]